MSTAPLDKLRQLTQIDVQRNWRYSLDNNRENWQIPELNQKGYIIWAKGRQVCILEQKITIPHSLEGYPLEGFALRLILTWWAEDAQIYVNGKLVQRGDLFDSTTRLLLTPCAIPGEEIIVRLRLISPNHDIGGLMRSKLVYENTSLPLTIEPGFVADELTVLSNYLDAFTPEEKPILAQTLAEINWELVGNRDLFNQCLQKIRHKLEPLASKLKERCFHLLGHAHLDMAWLWQVNETWEVAQNTFTSVLNLHQDFPELKFGHTSPALYAWIERYRPELFQRIQEAFRAKWWEILGGMWVEPDVNLPSGESLIRQLLYGQRYFREKFGTITRVAWLPDSFGFSWQLPQILKQAGIEYFVTGKLHWNDTTKFPYGCFHWQSPDGTKLFTLMSPPNVAGVMDTNPITMSDYAIDWEKQTGLKDIFWLPGVGDHGGGPTRDMLEVARLWQQSPFFPQIRFSLAVDYLDRIRSHYENPSAQDNTRCLPRQEINQLPVWDDELYLEFHRGCYTTHGEQKSFNRRCEHLLYQAELWSSLSSFLNKDYVYPKTQLEDAWKRVLFNQFHDILPGTSIPEVFVEANQDWALVEQVTSQIIADGLQVIACRIKLPRTTHAEAKPLIVFNPLNWKVSQVVSVEVARGKWMIWDIEGSQLPSQKTGEDKLLFFAQDIPGVGYKLYWLIPVIEQEISPSPLSTKGQSPLTPLNKGGISSTVPTQEEIPFTSMSGGGISPAPLNNAGDGETEKKLILENEKLKVVINPDTGNLSSIYDKRVNRETLRGEGNNLQAYQDQGQYWDGWNIDPNYKQHPLPEPRLKSIEYIEQGSIRNSIRVIRQLGSSEICQDYVLDRDSPLLKIVTTVDWQETHVLLKATFPLNVENEYATYEIPCGAIERPTNPQTPSEKAKWEVYGLHWGDITDKSEEYGVSLLNDCKYGYDSQGSTISLTLLRSPTWPDPNTDQGIHQFTYLIYPHQGNWKDAKTVHRGYELNIPLSVLTSFPTQEPTSLPPIATLLEIKPDNLILIACKPAEDHPDSLIVRLYESEGKSAQLYFNSELGLTIGKQVNLLEELVQENTQIAPWKIVSCRCSKQKNYP